jgi:hypothetical protein
MIRQEVNTSPVEALSPADLPMRSNSSHDESSQGPLMGASVRDGTLPWFSSKRARRPTTKSPSSRSGSSAPAYPTVRTCEGAVRSIARASLSAARFGPIPVFKKQIGIPLCVRARQSMRLPKRIRSCALQDSMTVPSSSESAAEIRSMRQKGRAWNRKSKAGFEEKWCRTTPSTNLRVSSLSLIVIGNVKGVAIFPKHSSSDIIQSYVPSRLAPDWVVGYSHGPSEVL